MRRRAISLCLGLVAGGAALVLGSVADAQWKRVKTALFKVELPQGFRQTEGAWKAAQRTGRWHWESANRNFRLTVVVEPAPKSAVTARVDALVKQGVLPKVARWRELGREVVDVDGRKVVLLFGHGMMRRNQRLHPHGVAIAAYLAKRGLLAKVVLVAAREKIAELEKVAERILSSTDWLAAGGK